MKYLILTFIYINISFALTDASQEIGIYEVKQGKFLKLEELSQFLDNIGLKKIEKPKSQSELDKRVVEAFELIDQANSDLKSLASSLKRRYQRGTKRKLLVLEIRNVRKKTKISRLQLRNDVSQKRKEIANELKNKKKP